METSKPFLKDKDGEEVDVHMYRSMIGSLMYLSSSRPDIMFACKKQTVVANSTTEAEYVDALSYRGQVLWIQNQCWITDGKKVFITEASIRYDLKLNDAEECLCAKTTSWNEFSSTLASAIICLANNQKFNFSKYILDNLKKNLEADVPFYMFPRKETKVSPTKIHIEDHVPTTSNDPLPSGEDIMELKELMNLCTNLSNKVLDLENEVIEMKSLHKAKIAELESRVEKLEEEKKSLTKELKSFNTRVESLTIKETVVDKEESSKQRRKIADIDADAKVNLENVYNLNMAHKETVLSMQDVIDADVKEVAEEMVEVMEIAKIIVDEVSTIGGELNAANEKPVKDRGNAKLVEEPEILKSRKVKIAINEEVARIEAEWNADMKDNNDWNKVVEQVQSRQSDADNTKKQKLEEQEEADELKKNLKIVPDDEDDVFMNVTPLSFKPSIIMDYKIYKEGKKEHFQIIRANVQVNAARRRITTACRLNVVDTEMSKEIKITAVRVC
nr:hypothetical protein [Tanacetum cinerariifolium]